MAPYPSAADLVFIPVEIALAGRDRSRNPAGGNRRHDNRLRDSFARRRVDPRRFPHERDTPESEWGVRHERAGAVSSKHESAGVNPSQRERLDEVALESSARGSVRMVDAAIDDPLAFAWGWKVPHVSLDPSVSDSEIEHAGARAHRSLERGPRGFEHVEVSPARPLAHGQELADAARHPVARSEEAHPEDPLRRRECKATSTACETHEWLPVERDHPVPTSGVPEARIKSGSPHHDSKRAPVFGGALT
jgi:hypothetical protein